MNSKFRISSSKINMIIVIIAVVISNILYNIIDADILNSGEPIYVIMLNTMFVCLTNILTLGTYIILMNKPYKALMMLFAAQISTFGSELISGVSLADAIFDLGLSLSITTCALIIHWTLIKKHIDTKDKLSKKIYNIINYEREPFKVNVITRLIIYSLFVTCIMAFVNNKDSMNLIASNSYTRVFAAIALLLPAFTILSIVSTSVLAYDILIVQVVMEIITLRFLITNGRLSVGTIIAILVELYIIYTTVLYKIPVYIASRNKHSNKKLKKLNEENSK